MRVSIVRGIRGSEVDRALPKRYFGVADLALRRLDRLEALAFPDSTVATSADVSRALRRLGDTHGIPVAAFMTDATVEAMAALSAADVRAFRLRSYGWTDEMYAGIRQTKSHEPDRRRRGK